MERDIEVTPIMRVILDFDVVFNDDQDSNSKGFCDTFEFCKDYIEGYNGTTHSYFADYKGGTVSVVCIQTGDVYFETTVL